MKKAAAFFTVLAAVLPLAAFDAGGKIADSTKYQGKPDSYTWYQSTAAHVWFTSVFNEEYKLKLSADGSYEYRYDEKKSSDTSKNIVDLNLFKLSGTFTTGSADTLKVGLGRFSVSDLTGIVFSQLSDGLFTKYSMPGLEVSMYGGYTRFLNAHNVSITTPSGTSYNPSYDTVYVLSAPYVPVGLTVSFPSLFANQTLSVEGWGFADTSDDAYNRWYGTAALSGPLAKKVFYTVSTTAETEKFDAVSDLTKASVSFYPVPAAYIGFNGIYASGKNGFLSKFTGFSTQTADLAFDEPGYSGLIKAELAGSYSLKSALCIAGSAACVFACPDSSVSYDGWQWQCTMFWNIFHDLQISAGASQYFADDTARNKTCFTAGGSFIF